MLAVHGVALVQLTPPTLDVTVPAPVPEPGALAVRVQELGETVFETARRELAEETGVEAEPFGSLPVLDIIRPDGSGRIRSHWPLVPVLCDWRRGDGTLSDEVLALRWITPAAISTSGLDVLPDLERLAALAMSAAPT